jgi:hypothetical protein
MIEIHGEAGDILVSKKNGTETEESEQNLVIGSDIDLDVRRGEHERRDGIVAYCIDLQRHSPTQGVKYDVLGSAADNPHPAMQALFRIAQVIDERQPAELEATAGAQSAVWWITNDSSAEFDDEAKAILEAAGVDTTATFAAPHFLNPNAGNPNTGAVTETEVVPPAELHTPQAPGTPPAAPVLGTVKVAPGKVRSGSKGLGSLLSVSASLANSGDTVQVTLERLKGGQIRTVKDYGQKALDAGDQSFGLILPPKLKAGTYQVTLSGASGTQSGQFKVAPAKKKRKGAKRRKR